MVTKKQKEQTPIQSYDDLNKILVPLAALRFELAGLTKQEIHEYPLGDLLLLIQMLVHQKDT